MQNEDEYYQLPESSGEEIKKMIWALLGFFGFLLVCVIIVVVYAQEIATKIPFAAEQRFVKPYESLIKKWYPSDVGNNPEVELYLQNLVESLSVAMSMPEDIEVTVHYLDLDVTNAFATLGGHVFIFKGLIEQMPDENSLAMILSHELAHIQHRDPVAAMGRGFAIQMLYGFVTNDYSSSADMLSLSGEVGMSFFSRTQEKQADLKALNALQKHYGHISGHDDFFKNMLEETDDNENVDGIPVWLQTHPELQERIDYLREAVTDNGFSTGQRLPFPEILSSASEGDEEEY